jgi:hypothetical protein
MNAFRIITAITNLIPVVVEAIKQIKTLKKDKESGLQQK